MKNRLIILLLLFTSWQSNAQKNAYINLLDTNKLWVESMIMEFGGVQIEEYCTDDTVKINDTTFYILKIDVTGKYNRYLREDTIKRKVWFRYFSDYQEQLYYDFSMEVGDSISFYPLTEDYMKLEQIQTESIFGYERKVYYFNRTWEAGLDPVIWVEGIGSLAGILHPDKAASGFWTWVDPYELNCYYHNEELLYQSDMASQYGCHFESLDISDMIQQDIYLYPNPVSNKFSVKCTEEIINDTPDLYIYDITGKCILERRLTSVNENIEVPQLYSGIYIIKIVSNNQILYHNKFIKN